MEVLLIIEDFSKTFSRKMRYLVSSISIKIIEKLFEPFKKS
jgi:hypothetical protein